MKVINPDTGFLAYQKIFSNLLANNCHSRSGNNDPLSGERMVSATHLTAFHLESKLLHLILGSDQREHRCATARFSATPKIAQLIFKTSIHEIRENVLTPCMIPHGDESSWKIPSRTRCKVRLGLDPHNDVLRGGKTVYFGIIHPQVGESSMKVESMSECSRERRDEVLSEER